MQIENFLYLLNETAPLGLASDWDKAGLQIEPLPGETVTNVLITLDLTPSVLAEAVEEEIDFIIAYHPLIFDPLPNLKHTLPTASLCIECIKYGITVYSPHTALDAVPGGMTDWLTAAVGTGDLDVIDPSEQDPDAGHGRVLHFSTPQSLEDVAHRIQTTLGLSYVRIAHPFVTHESTDLTSAAVCPGAGASLLLKTEADLLVTGEMRHHDLLAATAKGQAVILLEHAQSERGFLSIYKDQLQQKAASEEITFRLSESDVGPLSIAPQ